MTAQFGRSSSGSWPAPREVLKAGLILALLTLATRFWTFGNPVIGVDEQFYLLVGDRLRHGVLPYVDIWDRKPIGLFLIYAFACWIFADPVLGYQLLAAISIIATSCLIFTIARRVTSFTAALAGAAAYPAWLTIFSGMGGQASLFYDLPMAAAAALTLSAFNRPDDYRLTNRGCGIMLLTGLAIQIKYTVIFEGIYFALALLGAGWRHGRSITRLGIDCVVWATCALVPTMVAFGAYFAMGHGAAFFETNFVSIFGDKDPSLLTEYTRLAGLIVGISPFLICAWVAVQRWRTGKQPGSLEARWILGWSGASLAGFLLYGVWFDFYVLPLLVPFGVVAALAFDSIQNRRRAIAMILGLGLSGGIGRDVVQYPDPGSGREVARLTSMVQSHLGQGCLYVNEDLPILYYFTHSCLPTRYVFPEHLTGKRYQHSLGVDQLGELRRVLAQRPSVIVISTEPDDDTVLAERQLLIAELKLGYRPIGTAKVGSVTYTVYARA